MALEQNTSAGRRTEYNSKLETTIGTVKNDLEKTKAVTNGQKKTTKPYNWSKLTNEGTSAI